MAHSAAAAQISFKIDRHLHDSDVLKSGCDPQWRLQCIHTPGHDPGHLCFLEETTGALLSELLQRAAGKTVVAALGNPYLAAEFPSIQNYLCAFSNVAVSEVSTVKALFGEIPVHGRLPVTIPGIAPRGSGLDRPARPQPGAAYVKPD